MRSVVVIADDLTGAADTGLSFRNGGLTVQIRLSGYGSVAGTLAEVVVLSTETRSASANDAKRILQETGLRLMASVILQDSSEGPSPLLFKKIDSTLRGWVGIEVRVLLDTIPGRTAWIVPSYPRQGRRMENGVYTVHGNPVATTEFAQDIPDCPDDSRILRLFEMQMGETVAFVGAEVLEQGAVAIAAYVQEITRSGGIRAILFDAATDDHISEIVAASHHLASSPLWVGSAGLAGLLVQNFPHPPIHSTTVPSVDRTSGRQSGPIVLVAGSRNPTTRRQVAFLKTQLPFLRHQVVGFSDIEFSLDQEGDVLLTLPELEPTAPVVNSLEAAERLGAVAAQTILATGSCRLILTGGDIAAATCRHLTAEALDIMGAVEEGIPLLQLRGGSAEKTLAVTKAGGFGTEESLYRAFKLLKGAYE